MLLIRYHPGSPSTRRLPAAIAIWFVLIACSGCGTTSPSAIEPQGHGARQIADLWWFMLAVATVVYIVVMGLLIGALIRPRRNEPDVNAPPPPGSTAFLMVGGVAMPVVILAVLFILTLQTSRSFAPPGQSPPLVVEVIGHQWWWEVRYPDYGITTANEIHIPAGENVQLKLESADVIHSFWVPELHGKIDMIPGQTNTLWIHADEAGDYRGQCAEFCGLQHAHMAFYVVAEEPDDFAAWIEREQQPAPTPDDPVTRQGQQVFLGAACVYCHTIRGTNATSNLGPDLTHFASRRTIGAGAVPNTRGHLAGWIIDAQAIKPGNQMPPMYLEADALQALLVYMETLR